MVKGMYYYFRWLSVCLTVIFTWLERKRENIEFCAVSEQIMYSARSKFNTTKGKFTPMAVQNLLNANFVATLSVGLKRECFILFIVIHCYIGFISIFSSCWHQMGVFHFTDRVPWLGAINPTLGNPLPQYIKVDFRLNGTQYYSEVVHRNLYQSLCSLLKFNRICSTPSWLTLLLYV